MLRCARCSSEKIAETDRFCGTCGSWLLQASYGDLTCLLPMEADTHGPVETDVSIRNTGSLTLHLSFEPASEAVEVLDGEMALDPGQEAKVGVRVKESAESGPAIKVITREQTVLSRFINLRVIRPPYLEATGDEIPASVNGSNLIPVTYVYVGEAPIRSLEVKSQAAWLVPVRKSQPVYPGGRVILAYVDESALTSPGPCTGNLEVTMDGASAGIVEVALRATAPNQPVETITPVPTSPPDPKPILGRASAPTPPSAPTPDQTPVPKSVQTSVQTPVQTPVPKSAPTLVPTAPSVPIPAPTPAPEPAPSLAFPWPTPPAPREEPPLRVAGSDPLVAIPAVDPFFDPVQQPAPTRRPRSIFGLAAALVILAGLFGTVGLVIARTFGPKPPVAVKAPTPPPNVDKVESPPKQAPPEPSSPPDVTTDLSSQVDNRLVQDNRIGHWILEARADTEKKQPEEVAVNAPPTPPATSQPGSSPGPTPGPKPVPVPPSPSHPDPPPEPTTPPPDPTPKLNLLTANQSGVEDSLAGLLGWAALGRPALSRDPVVAHEGYASAIIENTTGTAQDISIITTAPRVAVRGGNSYTFSVWTKARTASGRVRRLKVMYFGRGGSNDVVGVFDSAPSSATAGWKRLTLTTTAPSGATSASLDLTLIDADVDEAIWWDGARFE